MKRRSNGEGSIRFDEKRQEYVGQVCIDGKRISMYSHKGESLSKFKQRFNERIIDIRNGNYIEKNSTTIRQIATLYIEQRFKDGYTIACSYTRNKETLKALCSCLGNYADKPIQKITVNDICECKDQMRLYSNSCINKMWNLLAKTFKIAYGKHIIPFNFFADETIMQKPISSKAQNKVCALTTAQEEHLRQVLNDNIDNIYAQVILVQLNTGMRIGEVLARTFNDVDFKNRTLNIHNTLTEGLDYKRIIGEHTKIYDKANQQDKGARIIPIDDETMNIIYTQKNRKIINSNNLIFYDYKKNSLLHYNEINSWLTRLNAKYKIADRLSSHMMRHTRVTRLQERNINLAAIQHLVGHVAGSSITNNIYTDVSTDFLKNELKKIN